MQFNSFLTFVVIYAGIVLFLVVCALMFCMFKISDMPVQSKDVVFYINGETGCDSRKGKIPSDPLKTVQQAIHLLANDEPSFSGSVRIRLQGHLFNVYNATWDFQQMAAGYSRIIYLEPDPNQDNKKQETVTVRGRLLIPSDKKILAPFVLRLSRAVPPRKRGGFFYQGHPVTITDDGWYLVAQHVYKAYDTTLVLNRPQTNIVVNGHLNVRMGLGHHLRFNNMGFQANSTPANHYMSIWDDNNDTARVEFDGCSIRSDSDDSTSNFCVDVAGTAAPALAFRKCNIWSTQPNKNLQSSSSIAIFAHQAITRCLIINCVTHHSWFAFVAGSSVQVEESTFYESVWNLEGGGGLSTFSRCYLSRLQEAYSMLDANLHARVQINDCVFQSLVAESTERILTASLHGCIAADNIRIESIGHLVSGEQEGDINITNLWSEQPWGPVWGSAVSGSRISVHILDSLSSSGKTVMWPSIGLVDGTENTMETTNPLVDTTYPHTLNTTRTTFTIQRG